MTLSPQFVQKKTQKACMLQNGNFPTLNTTSKGRKAISNVYGILTEKTKFKKGVFFV